MYLKFPHPMGCLKHTFPAGNPLSDSHMSCFTLTFFNGFISFSHMPNGLSSMSCKFIDKMILITATLKELNSSILGHVKLFLLFSSLLGLNLFWLLFKRPGCYCSNISGSIILERDCLTWGFVTIRNLLERIFFLKLLSSIHLTNSLNHRVKHTYVASCRDLHVCCAYALGETGQVESLVSR